MPLAISREGGCAVGARGVPGSESRETCQHLGRNRAGCSGDEAAWRSTPVPIVWPPSQAVDRGMTNDTTEEPLEPTELLVCIKCKRGHEIPEDHRRPGQRLFEELSALGLSDGIRLTAVECLQNCDHGCTIALRGGARWTYVYGNVDETSHSGTISDGASRYHRTRDGLIPWRERPEHFKRNCVARIPPVETIDD